MDAVDPFADYPELLAWRQNLSTALEAFEAEIAYARSIGGDYGLAHFCNALTQCHLAIAEANGAIGIGFTQADVKAILLESWPSRGIEGVEARAIATRIAYTANFRSAASGAKDSRIQAAMLFAAQFEGLEGLDPIETVRKSIQRFRSKVRGKHIFRLDRASLTIECLDAESTILEGLPGKKGRPPKSRSAN